MRPPATSRDAERRLLLLALALFAGHAWILRHFVVDDAFITFRYARNIAAGLGAVFNPGERVEGFSNPVYTAVLALLTLLTRNEAAIPAIGRVLGVIAASGSLVVLALLPGVRYSAAALLAAFMAAATTGFALWSVGGLETPLYGFLILAALAATLARPTRPAAQIGTGILLSLVALSRPEGILTALVLFLARAVDPETRRDLGGHLRVGAAFAVPLAAYLGFRLLWFGDWLPNTYYAKKTPLETSFRKGLWYLVSFVHYNGGKWLYIATPLAFVEREGRRASLLAAAVIGASAAFILAVGGDWMDHHRFLAPVIPLIFLLTARGWAFIVSLALRPLGSGGQFPRWIRVAGLALVLAALLRDTVPGTLRQRDNPYVNAAPYYITLGRVVGVIDRPEWTVAVHDIGAIGWYGRMRVLDLLGLVDVRRARRDIGVDEMVAERAPEIVILHYDNRTPPEGRWRVFDVPDFESTYVVPASPVPLPESFRVRADLLPVVQARLAGMPPDIRNAVAGLNDYLVTHQPDGHPFRAGSP